MGRIIGRDVNVLVESKDDMKEDGEGRGMGDVYKSEATGGPFRPGSPRERRAARGRPDPGGPGAPSGPRAGPAPLGHEP